MGTKVQGYLSVLLVGFTAASIGSAGELSPRRDFDGVDDQGTAVKCAYLSDDPTQRSHYQCTFPSTARTIVAYGDKTNLKTWCAVEKGEYDPFNCVASTADFAHFFIHTEASATGLIACRMAYLPPKPIRSVICSVHHNPARGVFGTDHDRKNVAACTLIDGKRILIDVVTKDRDGYRAGDYGAILFDPETRVTLDERKMMRSADPTAISFVEAKPRDGGIIISMPQFELMQGEEFVGRVKRGMAIAERAKCVRGNAAD